jgi:hypothetical protein
MQWRFAAAVVVALMWAGDAPGADEAPTPSGPVLHRVLVDGSGGRVVVRLVASRDIGGTLKAVDQPSRVFLDLDGVVPGGQRIVPVNRGGVRQVRVALNRADPPVTRVVVDLERPGAYRLEQSGDRRELRIAIEHTASGDDTAVYNAWFRTTAGSIDQTLSRTRLRRPAEALVFDELERLKAEWAGLRQHIERMTAPADLRTEHALLLEAVRLGEIAAARREDALRGTADAATAEAGAAMLLARARSTIASR